MSIAVVVNDNVNSLGPKKGKAVRVSVRGTTQEQIGI